MEGVIEIPLSDKEKAGLDNSIAAVKGLVEDIKKLEF